MKPAPRGKPKAEAPFAWLSRKAFQIIERGKLVHSPAMAKLTYTALAVLASDTDPGNSFRATLPIIANAASLSVSAVKRALVDLETTGLICVERPKLKGPALITLNTVKSGRASDSSANAPLSEPSLIYKRNTIREITSTSLHSEKVGSRAVSTLRSAKHD